MSPTVAPPDWGALYSAHKDAMHRVAASVLRGVGLPDQAGDAVQDAVESLMASPPEAVRSWQAMMVIASKRKALDRVRSAEVRHSGPELSEKHQGGNPEPDFADDVGEDIDRQRQVAAVLASLKTLDERHREVVWRREALGHPRDEVAVDLGVTPARVSQITAAALTQLREILDEKEER